jgi:hypothetical protein
MRIPIDEAAWAAKDIPPMTPGKQEGFGFLKAGDRYRFMLPDRSDVIDVFIVDGALDLFPERSAAHKALLAALR